MEQSSGDSQQELSKLLSSWPDNQVTEFGQDHTHPHFIQVLQAFKQNLVKHKC